MAEQHHHHRHHRRDSATIYKERTLREIALRKKIEKAAKVLLIVLAIVMALAVLVVYSFG